MLFTRGKATSAKGQILSVFNFFYNNDYILLTIIINFMNIKDIFIVKY